MSAAVLSLTSPLRSSSTEEPLSKLEAVAAYLGLDRDELVAWLDHGGTLPVLARALGRSADDAVAIMGAKRLAA